MTQINATIIPDAEAFLLENMPDMEVDRHCAITRSMYGTKAGAATYFDEEENAYKNVTLTEHVVALQKMAELIDAKKLYVGCLDSASELADMANWDVEVVDAFFQLAYHGEVIYG